MTLRTLRLHTFLLPLLLLAACSRSGDEADATATSKAESVAVGVATPTQQVFHDHIEAFGTFVGDSRHTQTLTLPQAGQVVATEVTAGRRVSKGQVLLRLATDPALRSTYQQAQSALSLSRGELTRTQRLLGEHLATNAQLASARKALADAQSNLAAQGRLGGSADVAVLAAPADGVITAIGVAVGERVQAGAKLLDFTPQRALSAQLGVAPEQAAKIRTGMPVSVTPVYGDTAQPLQGSVSVVAGAINPQTHLVDVLANIDADQTSSLVAGAALHAQIEFAQHTAWAVPRDALLNDAQGSHVFQLHQGKAHRVDVEVIAPTGDPVGISGAVDGNDPVVTLGAYELSDGAAAHPQAVEKNTP